MEADLGLAVAKAGCCSGVVCHTPPNWLGHNFVRPQFGVLKSMSENRFIGARPTELPLQYPDLALFLFGSSLQTCSAGRDAQGWLSEAQCVFPVTVKQLLITW